MIIPVHPENPQERNVRQIVDILKKDGVIIYPTDTIYGLGCDIFNMQAVERICRIKQLDPKKAQLSFICADLSDLSNYCKSIGNSTFRLLKQHLPGPFTFILEASKDVPKLMKTKKNTVGIRVPDHRISQAIVKTLGNPIMSVSLPMETNIEYYTDPEIIHEQMGHLVDLVVDGGYGGYIPSTVVDFTGEEPVLIREGLGKWDN